MRYLIHAICEWGWVEGIWNDKRHIVQRQHFDDNIPNVADAIKDEDLPDFSSANDLMMRKTITVSNLDNYIISKQDNSMNEVRIIPLKLEIDLKTHDLKTKGIPPKKVKSKKKKEDLSI